MADVVIVKSGNHRDGRALWLKKLILPFSQFAFYSWNRRAGGPHSTLYMDPHVAVGEEEERIDFHETIQITCWLCSETDIFHALLRNHRKLCEGGGKEWDDDA